MSVSVCVVLEFWGVVGVLCVLCGCWCHLSWFGLCVFVKTFCEAMFKSWYSTSQFCSLHEVNADFFKMLFSFRFAHVA